ncbi:MAG: cutinase family protein [Mycolicibacterium sp.]|nr:cutinase family protein [Mycolicibacterium sp.]
MRSIDTLRKQARHQSINTCAVSYKAGKLQLHSGGDGAEDAISTSSPHGVVVPRRTKIVLDGFSRGASVSAVVAGVPDGRHHLGQCAARVRFNIAAVATLRQRGQPHRQASDPGALLGARPSDLQPRRSGIMPGPGSRWSSHTEGYVPRIHHAGSNFRRGHAVTGFSQTVPGYRTTPPGYGPTIPGGYGLDTSMHGRNRGYSPMPPGYGSQPSGPGPSTVGPRPYTDFREWSRDLLAGAARRLGSGNPRASTCHRCGSRAMSAVAAVGVTMWLKPIRATLSAIRRTSRRSGSPATAHADPVSTSSARPAS